MTEQLLLYLLAVLTVNLIPGPDMLYVISQSIGNGKRYGLVASLGVGVGCLIHTIAVSLGLSSLLLRSALAFTIVKYLGAAYLLYLGLSSVLKKSSVLVEPQAAQKTISSRKIFLQGFLTNVLNPKVVLFFLAFLPQFVSLEGPYPIAIQMLGLGFIFCCSGTIVNSLVALFFSAVKRWLHEHPAVLHLQQKITGFVLISFGFKLAVFEKP